MRNGLDGLDWKILNALQAGARLTNVEVARRLGVSEGTIRNRIRRMVDSGILNISARVDWHKLGYPIDAYIGIKSLGAHIREVARAVAQLDEARYVGITSGRFDIWVYASFKSEQDLRDFLLDKLPRAGNLTTETFQLIETAKGLAKPVTRAQAEDIALGRLVAS